MSGPLHITSGDHAGDNLTKSGIFVEVLVWRDILYDGPRNAGWQWRNIADLKPFRITSLLAGADAGNT